MTVEHFKQTRQVTIDNKPYYALGYYPYYDRPTFFNKLTFDDTDQVFELVLEDNLSSFFRSLSACDFIVGNGWVDLDDEDGVSDLAETVGHNLAHYMLNNRRDVYDFVGKWSGSSGYFSDVDATWDEVEKEVITYYEENKIQSGIIQSGFKTHHIEFPENFEGNQDDLKQIYIVAKDFDRFIEHVKVFINEYIHS